MSERVFVLGAGRVATALAGGLRAAGISVIGVWGRRREAAAWAAARAGVPAASESDLDEFLARCDVALIAVSDGGIAELAGRLADSPALREDHIALHTCGATPAREALAPLARRGARVGTLHPLRAISSGEAAMRDLAGTYIGVEGDAEARDVAARLSRRADGRVFELEGGAMAAYHAAAAMASNYAVALLDAAGELASEAGMQAPLAHAALAELARGSVEGVAERGPSGALTGPIRRGDRATVERHLAAMASAPELRALYCALGLRAIRVARSVGDVDLEALRAIEERLQKALGGYAEALVGDPPEFIGGT